MLTIREAGPADTGELAAMNKQLIEDEKHDNPMTLPQLEDRMKGFLSGDYVALLAIGEGVAGDCDCDGDSAAEEGADGQSVAVGYALIRKTAEPPYLRQFFICRGERRKGYGRQFFAKLLEYLGTDAIDIEVMAWNEAGKAFWESLGFKPRSIYMRYDGGSRGE
ncbi:MAG: GNAT family N-acetyltransferase [Clostridiales bacterium]|jgi:GNAT superfamily N-acetyltransferase|nr:GNAT family N-acetyltransferase [Clostridiales bacterium]